MLTSEERIYAKEAKRETKDLSDIAQREMEEGKRKQHLRPI
jgi:hypothetical protein